MVFCPQGFRNQKSSQRTRWGRNVPKTPSVSAGTSARSCAVTTGSSCRGSEINQTRFFTAWARGEMHQAVAIARRLLLALKMLLDLAQGTGYRFLFVPLSSRAGQ